MATASCVSLPRPMSQCNCISWVTGQGPALCSVVCDYNFSRFKIVVASSHQQVSQAQASKLLNHCNCPSPL